MITLDLKQICADLAHKEVDEMYEHTDMDTSLIFNVINGERVYTEDWLDCYKDCFAEFWDFFESKGYKDINE